MKSCIKCGNPPPLLDLICQGCFAESTDLVSIDIPVKSICCKHCFASHISGRWDRHQNMKESVEHIFLHNISWLKDSTNHNLSLSTKKFDETSYKISAKCSGSISEFTLSSELEIDMLVKFQVCENCSRQAGGYFESTLQLRSKRKSVLASAIEKVRNEISSAPPEIFSTTDAPVRGGHDFQLSSTNKARAIARLMINSYGGSVKEARKVVGKKLGRDVLRHTFGVRLPSILVGEFFTRNDEIWKVISIRKRKADIARVTGKQLRESTELELIEKYPIVGPAEDVQIISQRGQEFQVLNPFTLKTEDLRSPDGWSGETISALHHIDSTYFVWND